MIKKNKGFTLIELLTVIVLLGVIAAITVPIIVDTIENSRINSCEETVRTIESAAERWHAHNPNKIDKTANISVEISVEKLQEEGYLSAKDDIVNPINNESLMQEKVTITYDSSNHQYDYKMKDGICTK